MKSYLFLLCILFCFACSKDKDSGLPDLPDIPEEQATLSISSSRFLFSSDGGTDTLSIVSNYTWTITVADAWCQPSVFSGFGDIDVQVLAKANPDTEDRITRWVINAGRFCSDTVYFSQSFKDGNLNFSDVELQKYLLKNYDKNHDGYLSVSEAREVMGIAIQGNYLNLDGLNYFPELRLLSCCPLNFDSQFGLQKLDVSHNKYLMSLDCRFNQLAELDLSRNLGLEYLWCSSNKITTLDLKNHKDLKSLYCDDNQITKLGLPENAMLEDLVCDNNQLASLDVNSCPNLKFLLCGDNPIQNLEITNCPQLASLSFPKQLESLKISNNSGLQKLSNISHDGCTTQLKFLEIENCTKLQSVSWGSIEEGQLYSLSIKDCPILEKLDCWDNQVTNLNISGCTSLAELDCARNQLTTLDVSGYTSLKELYCYGNQLTTLNVSGCTSLKVLWCYDNQLTTLDVSSCTSLEKLTCYSNPNLKTIYKKKGQDINILAPLYVEIIEL